MQRLTLGIACAALFAAVGGPSYARDVTLNKLRIDDGKISGTAIKKRSLPATRLTNAAVASLKGNVGPAGPVNLRYVDGDITTISGQGGIAIVTATCPAGLYPISGGIYQFIGAFDTLIQYREDNSWKLVVKNTGNTAAPLKPFAVCISATNVG